ncbi:MAG: putative rRNA maturation factor [Lacrimispora sp.]|nr:putative rRNA maturation factor [Lacrimispora sp.]
MNLSQRKNQLTGKERHIMTINIEYEAAKKLKIPYEEIITGVAEEALDYEDCPYEAEINVLLTDNEDIRQINLEYRNIDSPTDVLSFPMIEYETPSDFDHLEEEEYDSFNPETGELLLGDIVVSVDKVEEQAEKYGHSMERELAFLIAHSMLHLCGYDHMEEDERLVMEQKQEEILSRRGYVR